jgi:translation initiation factor eIF-2B subunit beta
MIYEYSTTVLNFLVYAKATRNLEIIVVENETTALGNRMAIELAKHDMNITLIPFTNTFALMQRVNKIILGM